MASEPPPALPPERTPRDACARCGTPFREGAVFCEICGAVRPSLRDAPPTGPEDWRTWALRSPKYQYAVPQRNWRSVLRTISSALMITVAVSLVACLFTLVYGISLVWPEIVAGYDHVLFIVIPIIIPLAEISGLGLEIYYLFLVAAIVISAIVLFIKSFGGFKDELMGKGKSREHSPFFELCGLLFAVLFFNMAIVLVLMLFGYDPDVPSEEMEVWEMLFVLANASVWEELITRVLLIGVPLLLFDLMTNRLEKKSFSYLLGGGFAFGVPEVLLVVISSLMFGFAHFEAWGAWKIAPSALAGFAFGYLFLKYGLYASIMLHFAIDYLSMPGEVFDSLALQLLAGFAVIIWALIGIGFFIYYVVRVVEFFTERKFFEPKPTVVAVTGFYPGPCALEQYPGAYPGPSSPPQNQESSGLYSPPPPPPQHPAPAQQAWRAGAYVCPVCGHVQARWVDGRFQCLRCGNLS